MSTSWVEGIGVDCADVGRWRRMLRALTSGAAGRMFTRREHEYCRSFADPAPHYAARWCAKEAVFKALSGLAPADLRRIEIRRGKDGAPQVSLPGGLRGLVVKLSLTHTAKVAMAVAVAERKRRA